MRTDGRSDQDKVLTISRTGSVEVRWLSSHKAQCGYHGERLMTYHVTVKGRQMDCPNGWLLDNNDIPHYFEQKYARGIREFKSCEFVASQAVDDFREICRKSYHAKPFYIRVAVSAIAGSEIACEWTMRDRHRLA